MAIFHEAPPGATEDEGNFVFFTLIMQGLYPFVVTRPRSIVIFSITQDLLDLVFLQIFFDGYRSDEGSAHNTLV